MHRIVAALLVLIAVDAIAQPTIDPAVLRGTRPDPAGTPTVVDVLFFVVDVISINNVDQTFKADIVFRAEWDDPRLAGSDGRSLPLDEVWFPNVGIVNERSLDDLLPRVVQISADGHVTFQQRVIGDFAVRLDLRDFPRDEQVLPVQLVSYRHGPDEIEFRSHEASPDGIGDFSIPGWRVQLGEVSTEPVTIPATGRKVSSITFELEAQRNSDFYLLTMYLPLVFIALMAWSVFWIDPSLLPPQVAVSTASVFTMIAFRFSLGYQLPPVSYLTRMDRFVLGCTILVFLVMGHAIATGRLAKLGREDLARTMDRWGRWIYLAALAVLLGLQL